jgi:hypothetical protein
MTTVRVFNEMLGKTITTIEGGTNGDGEMTLATADGETFKFHHWQDCCEDVSINDVTGDINDLIGSPIMQAEEVSSEDVPEEDEPYESYTWTFYKFATAKGSVTVRWLGESNGYYSESVNYDHNHKE